MLFPLTMNRLPFLAPLLALALLVPIADRATTRDDPAPAAFPESAPDAPPSALVAAPKIDLGRAAPEARVPTTLWLVNPTPEAIEVVAIAGDCGCIRLERKAPFTIPAGEGLGIPFSISAPKEPGLKTKSLRVATPGAAPLTIPVVIEAIDPATIPYPIAEPRSALVAVPERLELGAHPAGTPVEARLWIVNAAPEARTLLDAKGSCSCMHLPALPGPETLAPRAAKPYVFTIDAPDRGGTTATKTLALIVDDGAPLKVVVRIAAE